AARLGLILIRPGGGRPRFLAFLGRRLARPALAALARLAAATSRLAGGAPGLAATWLSFALRPAPLPATRPPPPSHGPAPRHRPRRRALRSARRGSASGSARRRPRRRGCAIRQGAWTPV